MDGLGCFLRRSEWFTTLLLIFWFMAVSALELKEVFRHARDICCWLTFRLSAFATRILGLFLIIVVKISFEKKPQLSDTIGDTRVWNSTNKISRNVAWCLTDFYSWSTTETPGNATLQNQRKKRPSTQNPRTACPALIQQWSPPRVGPPQSLCPFLRALPQ